MTGVDLAAACRSPRPVSAARAARAAGAQDRAREFFNRLVDLGKEADTERDGLQEARQAMNRG